MYSNIIYTIVLFQFFSCCSPQKPIVIEKEVIVQSEPEIVIEKETVIVEKPTIVRETIIEERVVSPPPVVIYRERPRTIYVPISPQIIIRPKYPFRHDRHRFYHHRPRSYYRDRHRNRSSGAMLILPNRSSHRHKHRDKGINIDININKHENKSHKPRRKTKTSTGTSANRAPKPAVSRKSRPILDKESKRVGITPRNPAVRREKAKTAPTVRSDTNKNKVTRSPRPVRKIRTSTGKSARRN